MKEDSRVHRDFSNALIFKHDARTGCVLYRYSMFKRHWRKIQQATGIPCVPILKKYSIVFQRRQWHPTPVLLPGKSYGRRSLVGCSPWGCWGSDTTERLHFHFSLSCIGEGNGNPLQCSCLENPRDRGAWWAAVYGVAQSQTRLKWLSSSIVFQSHTCCIS